MAPVYYQHSRTAITSRRNRQFITLCSSASISTRCRRDLNLPRSHILHTHRLLFSTGRGNFYAAMSARGVSAVPLTRARVHLFGSLGAVTLPIIKTSKHLMFRVANTLCTIPASQSDPFPSSCCICAITAVTPFLTHRDGPGLSRRYVLLPSLC